MESAEVLSIIVFIIFSCVVTLPLADLTARTYVAPWLASQQSASGASPQDPLVVTLVVFIVMVVAFWLRAHVIAVST